MTTAEFKKSPEGYPPDTNPPAINPPAINPPDTRVLKQKIRTLIEETDQKTTPTVIENTLFSNGFAPRKIIRTALKSLIADGELEYTYAFGSSYVEKSFSRPVRISPSVVIKPHNMSCPATSRDIIINIVPGVSFGSGGHPTTRLSVQGIEYALRDQCLIHDFNNTAVLDIGTGSGILAICAMKFGIETATGLDTDPCALSEAGHNARANHLEHQMRICHPDDFTDARFSMVTANLRFPDLMVLMPVIRKNAGPGAPVILSGIRPEETESVRRKYTENGFACLRVTREKNWACVVLQKLSGDLFHL